MSDRPASRLICREGASCGSAPRFGFLDEAAGAPLVDRRQLQTFVNITRPDCASNQTATVWSLFAGVHSRKLANRVAEARLPGVGGLTRRAPIRDRQSNRPGPR